MSVSVTGTEEIIKNIEAKLGKARATRVINKTLRNAGKRNKEIFEQAVSSYIDTGETHDTVISSNVLNNPKRVETGWGQGSRWRLVHLNEFGYTRFGRYVSPRGIGKLQGAVDQIQATSLAEMRKDLEELAK